MYQKVCVSFDYEKDKYYYFMLKAWDRNSGFDFSFEDCTPDEIQSCDIGRIKAVLTKKISEASCLLVIVGEEANKMHRDSVLIGNRNWQNFEIAKAKELHKRIVAVKLQRENTPPYELLNCGASWAMSFSEDSIRKAMLNA